MIEFVRSAHTIWSASFVALQRRFARLACTLLILCGFSSVAHAQGGLAAPPPVFSSIDQYGVDLTRGALNVVTGELSIGAPGAGGLFFSRSFIGSGWRHAFVGTINSVPGSMGRMDYTVSTGTMSDQFHTVPANPTIFHPTQRRGGSLTYDAGTQRYTYISSNGSVAIFEKSLAGSGMPWSANEGRIVTLREADGTELTFHYVSATVGGVTGRRLQSVTNNLGYQLHFGYSNNSPANTTELAGPWQNIAQVTAINNAIDYCNPTAATCSLMTWPSVTFSLSGLQETITDAAGRATRITYNGSGQITAIRRPSSTTTDHFIFTYASGRVASAALGGSATTYAYSDAGSVRTTTATFQWSLLFPPRTYSITSTISTGRLLSTTNGEGETTAYQHDTYERVTRVTQPEDNYVAFTYDTRGNITETRQVAKPGSGLADIVTTAVYPASCSIAVTCNQPESTADARGFRTDYTYDTTHGGVLTITSPAPSGSAPIGSGIRPQTRYAYSSFFAYYKNSGGSIVAAPTPVYRLVETSSCATMASCDATSDETVATVSYGSNGVANNRLPLTTTVAAGNGAISATSTVTYDNLGNLLTINGPLSGSADTTRIRYNAARQVVGVIGPDPDGGGALKHRAVRTTYNADGQPTAVEQGTVDSQSDPDWDNFAVLERRETTYNFKGLPERVSFIAQGQTHAEVHMGYDPSNRLICVAQRMNPAAFGAFQACALTAQGSHGPDRITSYTYDEANRRTQVTQGYRTGFDTNSWTATYTDNGAIETLADANGNLTTYVYDGFDRLYRLRYPDPIISGSSATDFEEYAYDAASNVTAWRRRSNDTISFTYDNLSRLITTDAPGGSSLDVSATYDLLGRQLTQATSGQTLAFGYDQLSRLTSAQSAIGTVNYQYDAASRRTRITWPDAFYAQYDFDLTDAVTAIRENGASSGAGVLATYAYDNLGRRTSVTRGNNSATATTYAYDAASRLEELVNNLAGTTHDQTLEFGYNAASQIVSRDNSNATFDWNPLAAGLTTYADNNLNQYTSVGAASPVYDARGNLTSNGTRTFDYDVFNRLTSVSGAGSMTLGYDPAGRLYQTVASSTTTRFLYDGVSLIGEYNSSNALQRRYVHGPAVDEPIVWYEGSGTTDRRWLIADQLGSVTAVTNGSGAATTTNSYENYGIPNAWTLAGSRFRYTGQTVLPEAQLYYYRARAYDPALGRFLQTDPILYAGGMNLYAYVENDPLNMIDPLGLYVVCVGEWPNVICRKVRPFSSDWWRDKGWRNPEQGTDWQEELDAWNSTPAIEVIDTLTAQNGYKVCPVAEVDHRTSDDIRNNPRVGVSVVRVFGGDVEFGGPGSRDVWGVSRGGGYNFTQNRSGMTISPSVGRRRLGGSSGSSNVFVGVSAGFQYGEGVGTRVGVELVQPNAPCPGEGE